MVLFKLFVTFLKIGVFTFGSGYAMLALAQKEIVETKAWITASEFADAVALSEMTPGPIMVNLSTFVGMKTAGIPGVVMATLGLIFPPMIAISCISYFYFKYKNNTIVQRFFSGVRPAVIGLIISVVIKLGRSTLKDWKGIVLTIAAAGAVVAGIHPIFIFIAAGVVGFLLF